MRLVGKHLQSKEIARTLQLSPSTVDSYIKSACEKVGERSRRGAAARLSAYEATAINLEGSDIDDVLTTEAIPSAASAQSSAWTPLQWMADHLDSPGARTKGVITITAWASFALAALMTAQGVVLIVHSLIHPGLVMWPIEALATRRVWPDIFYTGAPAGRFLFALCFFVPGLALLKGGAAYRLAAWSTLLVLISTMCIPFGSAALTLIDTLQLAVHLSLLKLSRRMWVRVVIAVQFCTLAADIGFYIEGVIDGRTWDMVQIVSVVTMNLTVWASLVGFRVATSALIDKGALPSTASRPILRCLLIFDRLRRS